METEYLEKKGAYDNAKAGLESNVAKLQLEADSAEKDSQHELSSAHYYENMMMIDQVKLQRAKDERERKVKRQLPDGSVVNSYVELYSAKIKQQEASSKELRERKKHLQENHAPNARQVRMFKDLHKLLRCKVESQQRARAEANDMMAANQQDTNVLTMNDNDDVPVGGSFDDMSPSGRHYG